MLQRYGPFAFFAVAIVSVASIIYWGISRGDDDLFDDDDPFNGRIDVLATDDFRRIDLDGYDSLRRDQEVLITADNLIDWADAGATDDDAFAELFTSCDGVYSALLLLQTSPPQPVHIQGIATVCAEVQEGVVRKTPAEWAARISDQIPRDGYPYSGRGRQAILARWYRLRVWADNVISGREMDIDYVRRFCVREETVGFGLPVSDDEAEREEAIDYADDLRDLCETLDDASTAIALAERIDPDREVPFR